MVLREVLGRGPTGERGRHDVDIGGGSGRPAEAHLRMNAADLIRLLHKRYQPPEWAVLEELHNGTGATASRRFDAVAFNCWPSSGFVRYGFEVKVSRSDFARELENHEKRAALEAACHQVWFVVSAGVCQPREVPEPWGLLTVAGEQLRTLVKAQHRQVGPVPESLALCAIRRMVEQAAEYQRRHYILDGAELTQADIDAFVERKMGASYEVIELQRMEVQRDRDKLREERTKFETDADRWRGVWAMVTHAADQRGRHLIQTEPPTRDAVREALERIRTRGSGDLADKLRATRDHLDSVLAALAELTPEVE